LAQIKIWSYYGKHKPALIGGLAMLATLIDKLYLKVTGKKVALAFVFYAAFTILFQFIKAQMQAHFGGVSPLDFHTSYNASDAYSVLVSYGDVGRGWHIVIDFVDFLYIASYALFFGMLMSYVVAKAGYAQSKLRFVALFPFLMGLVDALENICILTLLIIYPTHLTAVADSAGLLTHTKFIMATANLALVAVTLVIFGWAKLVKKH
jgi:hypothetical protein